MIIVEPNSENIRTFRLSNVIGDNNAVFLFEILDIEFNQVKLFTGVNTSTYRSRYDRFNIEMVNSVADEDLFNSKIYLPRGQYRYNVYVFDEDYVVNGYVDPLYFTSGLDLQYTTGKIIETDQFRVKLEEPINYNTQNYYL